MIDTIVQVFREYTSITYSSETAAEDAEFPESTFGYIPEGMVRNEDECMEEKGYLRSTSYKGNNQTLFYLDEVLIAKNSTSSQIIDTENAIVRHFTIRNEQAISSEKGEIVIIVWTHKNVSYTLITYYLSYDEALKIAEGIGQK